MEKQAAKKEAVRERLQVVLWRAARGLDGRNGAEVAPAEGSPSARPLRATIAGAGRLSARRSSWTEETEEPASTGSSQRRGLGSIGARSLGLRGSARKLATAMMARAAHGAVKASDRRSMEDTARRVARREARERAREKEPAHEPARDAAVGVSDHRLDHLAAARQHAAGGEAAAETPWLEARLSRGEPSLSSCGERSSSLASLSGDDADATRDTIGQLPGAGPPRMKGRSSVAFSVSRGAISPRALR